MPSISGENAPRISFQDALFQDGGLFAKDSHAADAFDEYLRHAVDPGPAPSLESEARAPAAGSTPAPTAVPAAAPTPQSQPAAAADDRQGTADADSQAAEASGQRREDSDAPAGENLGDHLNGASGESSTTAAEGQSAEQSEASVKEEPTGGAKEDKPKEEESNQEAPVLLVQAQQAPPPAPAVKETQGVGAEQGQPVAGAPSSASKGEHPGADAGDGKAVVPTGLDPQAVVPNAGMATVDNAIAADAQDATVKAGQEQTKDTAAAKQNPPVAAEVGKGTAARGRDANSRRESTEGTAHGGAAHDGAAREGGKSEKARAAAQADAESQAAAPQGLGQVADAAQPSAPATPMAAPAAMQAAENLAQTTSDAKGSASGATSATGATHAADARASNSQRAAGSDLRNTAAATQGPDTAAADRAKFVQRVASAFQAATDPGGTVRLKLSPAELGSLRLEVSVRHGVLNAKIEAETEAARSLLMDSLPLLRERLAAQDIKVQQFQIDLRDPGQGGQGGLPGNANHSSSGGERGGNAPQPRWNAATEEPRPAEPITARGGAEPGRLNVIV